MLKINNILVALTIGALLVCTSGMVNAESAIGDIRHRKPPALKIVRAEDRGASRQEDRIRHKKRWDRRNDQGKQELHRSQPRFNANRNYHHTPHRDYRRSNDNQSRRLYLRHHKRHNIKHKHGYWRDYHLGHRKAYRRHYYNGRNYYYNRLGFYFPDYGFIRHGHRHHRHCPSWHNHPFVAAFLLDSIFRH